MSVRMNSDLPQGIAVEQLIDFAAPTALNTNVRGLDRDTGLTDFNLRQANSLLRAFLDLTLEENDRNYVIEFTINGFARRRFYSESLKSDQQFVPENFPQNFLPGQYQVQIRQTTGALAARTLLLKWQVPL